LSISIGPAELSQGNPESEVRPAIATQYSYDRHKTAVYWRRSVLYRLDKEWASGKRHFEGITVEVYGAPGTTALSRGIFLPDYRRWR
jgi:hypothetical protein